MQLYCNEFFVLTSVVCEKLQQYILGIFGALSVFLELCCVGSHCVP